MSRKPCHARHTLGQTEGDEERERDKREMKEKRERERERDEQIDREGETQRLVTHRGSVHVSETLPRQGHTRSERGEEGERDER
jgi:hypothetical protein